MTEDSYANSKAFVKEMRSLISNRDLVSIQQAVRQMQDWMNDHPNDMRVGTALEEFDILEEAARIVEERQSALVHSHAK